MSRHPNLLDRSKSALVIIDIQERIARVMPQRETVLLNVAKLIHGCQILNVPVFYTEQYPQGLGRTEAELLQLLPAMDALEKRRFSVLDETGLREAFRTKGVQQILLCGMETHVCVLQSALDFTQADFQVHVIIDAVCSRKLLDYEMALERLHRLGVTLSSTEAALFELTETSASEEFKQISRLIK